MFDRLGHPRIRQGYWKPEAGVSSEVCSEQCGGKVRTDTGMFECRGLG